MRGEGPSGRAWASRGRWACPGDGGETPEGHRVLGSSRGAAAGQVSGRTRAVQRAENMDSGGRGSCVRHSSVRLRGSDLVLHAAGGLKGQGCGLGTGDQGRCRRLTDREPSLRARGWRRRHVVALTPGHGQRCEGWRGCLSRDRGHRILMEVLLSILLPEGGARSTDAPTASRMGICQTRCGH